MSDLAFQQRQAKIRDVDFEYGTALAMKSSAWDYQTMYSCVCDSTWPVGFNSGERQLAEYFGPDCSLSKLFYEMLMVLFLALVIFFFVQT